MQVNSWFRREAVERVLKDVRWQDVALFALALLLAVAGLFRPLTETPDSGGYFAAADSLASGQGFGNNYVWWPPLYPLVLALHVPLGLDIAVLTRGLNALCYLALVAMTLHLARRELSHSGLVLAVPLLVVLGSPVALVYGSAWSETLFLPLTIAALLCWSRVLAGGAGRWALPAGYLAVAGALLCRHVGISLLFAVAACLLLAPRLPWRKRIVGVLWLGVVALPYAVWLLRTRLVSGFFSGPRPPAIHGLCEHLRLMTDVLAHWLMPHVFFEGNGALWLLLLLPPLLVAGVLAWRRPAPGRPLGAVFWLALIFSSFYVVVLMASASRYAMDAVGVRLLAPVFPLLVLAGGIVVDRVALRLGSAGNGLALRVLEWGFGLWLLQWLLAPNPLLDLLL